MYNGGRIRVGGIVMKELYQNLSEVIGAKKDSELAHINERFLNVLNEKEIIVYRGQGLFTEDTGVSQLLVEYIHNDIKRRAQTIGTAYRIATQFMIALYFKRFDLITSIVGNMDYFTNKGYLDDIYNDFDTQHIKQNHTNSIFFITGLENTIQNMEHEKLLRDVAQASLTFAWIETYYKTGFMPQDLSVMAYDSETNNKLVDEITVLLQNNTDLYLNLNHLTNWGKALSFGQSVVSNNYGIAGTAGIVSGNNLIELKTTGTYPTASKIRQDAKHAIALKVLEQNPDDTNAPQIDINNIYLYYVRFNELIRVDISE